MNTDTADRLKSILADGDHTIYCEVTHVARSGMSRNITPLVAVGPGDIRDISHLVLAAGIGSRPRGHGRGVTMSGCGMDMTFALTYELSMKLYDDGYRIKNR